MAIVINHQRMVKSKYEKELCNNSAWLIEAGILLMALGLVAIADIMFFYIETTYLIGVTFIAAGVIFIAHAVKFWYEKSLGFCLHLLAGVLYGSVGTIIFMNMQIGMLYLVLLLAAFYVAIGIFLISTAVIEGLTNLGWSWTFLSGFVNVLLALVIWTHLQNFNLHLLGSVIAIDVFFTGLSLLMLGVHVHKAYQSSLQ
jgi:uncharacterized membrane protein HdeD (DUF308 family)